MSEVLTGEVLTIEEIEAKYTPNWVLIGDPQIDEGEKLLAGVVLFSSLDRGELYRKAMELKLDRVAIRNLAPWPADVAFVL